MAKTSQKNGYAPLPKFRFHHKTTLLPILLCFSIITRICTSSAAGQETLIGIVGHDFIMLGADSSASSGGGIALTASNLDKIKVLIDPLITNDDDDSRKKSRAKKRSLEQQTIVAAAAGDTADCENLLDILSVHARIREYEMGIGCDAQCIFHGFGEEDGDVLSPAGIDASAIAYLARGEISNSLRSGSGSLNVCLLVAGMVRCSDETKAITMEEENGEEMFPLFSQRIQSQIAAAVEKCTQSKPKNNILSKSSRSTSPPNQYLQPRLFWIDAYGSLQKVRYGAHGFASNFVLSILDQGYHPHLSKKECKDLILRCFEQLRTRYVINSPSAPCIKCVDANGCTDVL